MLKKVAIMAGLLSMAIGVLLVTFSDRTFAVKNDLTIDRPAMEIWPVLTDVEKWPAWWPGVREARLTPGWRKGATLDLVLKGRPEKDPATVETVLPAREMTWERPGILGSVTRTSVVLEAAPDGTRISLKSFIKGPQAFLAGFTGKEEFARYHEAVLVALKARLQQMEKS
jgi:uncharacterized protein YndB with AHSA1/START domain